MTYSRPLLGTNTKKVKMSWMEYIFTHLIPTWFQSFNDNFVMWRGLITENYEPSVLRYVTVPVCCLPGSRTADQPEDRDSLGGDFDENPAEKTGVPWESLAANKCVWKSLLCPNSFYNGVSPSAAAFKSY